MVGRGTARGEGAQSIEQWSSLPSRMGERCVFLQPPRTHAHHPATPPPRKRSHRPARPFPHPAQPPNLCLFLLAAWVGMHAPGETTNLRLVDKHVHFVHQHDGVPPGAAAAAAALRAGPAPAPGHHLIQQLRRGLGPHPVPGERLHSAQRGGGLRGVVGGRARLCCWQERNGGSSTGRDRSPRLLLASGTRKTAAAAGARRRPSIPPAKAAPPLPGPAPAPPCAAALTSYSAESACAGEGTRRPLISTNWKCGTRLRSARRLKSRITSSTVAVLPVPGMPETYRHLPHPVWSAGQGRRGGGGGGPGWVECCCECKCMGVVGGGQPAITSAATPETPTPPTRTHSPSHTNTFPPTHTTTCPCTDTRPPTHPPPTRVVQHVLHKLRHLPPLPLPARQGGRHRGERQRIARRR